MAKQGKKFLFVLMFLFFVVFLVSCGDEQTYSLNLPSEITASLDDLAKIKDGAEVTLTVAVPEGKEIDKLVVNGEEVVATNNTYKVKITKNTTVTVTFKDQTTLTFYNLVLPAGVTANISELAEILSGSEIVLTINVPEGKLLDYLKVNNQSVTVDGNKYTFTIGQNTTVEVAFKDPEPEPVYYKLTLPADVTANISDLNQIAENSEVTLTIDVPTGKLLDYLKVNGQAVTVTGNTYLFVISKNTDVEVAFKDPAPTDEFVKLTLPSGVTANVSNLDEVLKNSNVTLTIDVPAGKLLDYLKVNEQAVTVVGNTYLFVISKDTDVEVAFKDPAPTDEFVKLILPSGVTANVANLDEVLKGSDVTLTINVPSGKLLDSLVVDGHQVAVTGNTYTFTILKDVTVSVSFKDPAPTDVFFELTLPSGVTANVTNLNEILEGTAITLAIAAPTDYRLDYLKVNAELVNVVNNSYTFTITQDTVVEVEFKYDDGWEEALFSEVVEFLNQLSGEFFQPGTLGFELSFGDEDFEILAEALILFDNDLNVAKAVINYDSFYEEELQGRLGIYNDGLYLYYLEEAFGEDIEDGEESMVIVLNINAQLLETIVPLIVLFTLGEEIDFMPSGPHSINELLDTVIGFGTEFITEDLEILKLFEFSKKDDFLKLTLSFDDQTIFDLIQEILLEELFADFDPEELELEIDGELQFNFELIFANHKFHSINLNLFLEDEDNQLQIDAFFGYTTKTIEVPFDLTQFDVSELESLTYNFHLGENKVEEFILSKALVEEILDDLPIEAQDMLIASLKPYKKGYHAIGLYLDADFTTPLSGDDLLTDNLDVYVEWEENLTYEQLLALLIEDGVLYLSHDNNELLYYEDDTTIVFYYEYGDFIYWRKDTNIAYSVVMDDDGVQLYELPLDFSLFNPLLATINETEETTLLEYQGAYFNLDAGFILAKEKMVLMFGDEYFYPGFYFKAEPDQNVLDMLAALEAAIDDAALDEIVFYYPYDYARVQDINTMEEDIVFVVYYSSGISKLITLGELKTSGQVDYILPSAENDYTFTMIIDGEAEIDENFLFYDSNLGLVAYFEDIDELHYVAELEELPALDDIDYQTLIGWRLSEQTIFSTIAELKAYQTTKKIIYLDAKSELFDFEIIKQSWLENDYLKMSGVSNDIIYDFENNLWSVSTYYGRDMALQFTDDYLIVWDEEIYYEIPLENFNFESFYFSIVDYHFSALSNLYHEDVRALFIVQQLLNNQFEVLEKRSNHFIFETEIYLYIFDEGFAIEHGWNHNSFFFIEDATFDLPEQNYNYQYTIENNLELNNLIIKSQYDNPYMFQSDLAYTFDGYVFDEYYLIVAGNPVLDQPFNPYDNEENEVELYAVYIPLVSPLTALEKFFTTDKFILESSSTTFQVERGKKIHVYQDENLKFALDLESGTNYRVYDGTLFEVLDADSIFNLLDFFDSLVDDEFSFNRINSYYYDTYPPFYGVYHFEINVAKDYLILLVESLNYDGSHYQFSDAEFSFADLGSYPIDTEKISVITPSSYFSFLNVDDFEWALWFDIIYNTGIEYRYYYDEFIDMFDASLEEEDGEYKFRFQIDGTDYLVDFEESNLTIYDSQKDVVVIFEELNEFYYLSDLTELPVPQAETVSFFQFSYWVDRANGNPATIEYLNNNYSIGEVAYLDGWYEYLMLDQAIDVLGNNGGVNFVSSYNYYSYEGYYDFEDDQFLIVKNTNNDLLTITFEADFVIIEDGNNYLKFAKDKFVLEIEQYYSIEIKYFDDLFNDLLALRDVLLGDYEIIYTGWYYELSNGFTFEVYYDYLEVNTLWGYFNLMIEKTVIEPPVFDDEFNFYFTVANNINDEIIIFNSDFADTFDNNFYFLIPEHDFVGYYFYDEEGNPDFDNLVTMWEIELGATSIFANYN